MLSVSNVSQISENKQVLPENNFTLLFKLFVWSLIYTRKSNDPEIQPCGALELIVPQSHVWLLSVTFQIYYSKSL